MPDQHVIEAYYRNIPTTSELYDLIEYHAERAAYYGHLESVAERHLRNKQAAENELCRRTGSQGRLSALQLVRRKA